MINLNFLGLTFVMVGIAIVFTFLIMVMTCVTLSTRDLIKEAKEERERLAQSGKHEEETYQKAT